MTPLLEIIMIFIASLADVVLSAAACVRLHGKGRKQRTVPLWHSAVSEIRAWQKVNPQLDARSPRVA